MQCITFNRLLYAIFLPDFGDLQETILSITPQTLSRLVNVENHAT